MFTCRTASEGDPVVFVPHCMYSTLGKEPLENMSPTITHEFFCRAKTRLDGELSAP